MAMMISARVMPVQGIEDPEKSNGKTCHVRTDAARQANTDSTSKRVPNLHHVLDGIQRKGETLCIARFRPRAPGGCLLVHMRLAQN